MYLCFCYYFEQAHFFYVQWLSGFPFCEAVILYSSLFKKLDPFCTHFFLCVLPSLYFEKLKLCPILLMLDRFHA